MLRRLDLRGPLQDVRSVLPRPVAAGEGPLEEVRAIVADVRQRGDVALRDMTARMWRTVKATGDSSLYNSSYPPLRVAPFGPGILDDSDE